MLPTIGGSEGCDYAFCRLTPDSAFSACSSHDFFLVVDGAEDDVTCYSEGEEEC
jgi:cytochrome b involved in lipid metabolism